MVRGDRSIAEKTQVDREHSGKTDSRRGSAIQNIPTPARGRSKESTSNHVARGPGSDLEELMRRKGVDDAWNALDEMQRQGITTDKFTISRMLMKTVGDGRWRTNPSRVYRGITLVEKFIDMQPADVDEVLFNALLDTCCRLKDLARLETTVQRMRDLKVSPSPVTLGILVKTYGQAGDLQKVLQVWSEMEKQRGQANAVTYGCMIDACVKCGNLEKAEEIFRGMQEEGKHRNTILYTTLIKGYGLEKKLEQALNLFREMPTEGVQYNTITYNSVIDACVKCGDLTTAEGLLRELTADDSQLEPDLITFSTLLKGYCNAGDVDKALQVVEAIKARGLRCDELVYNTLMDGCVKANDISAGVGLFEEMVQEGLRPSAITHSILARLYQRAGYEDDASEAVAQLYQHHGIERPAGSKSFNRRGNRSPPGSAGGRTANHSPLASPMAIHGDASRTWGSYSWGDAPALPGYGEYASEPSAPSTPLTASPMASPMTGPFLPAEAMQHRMVPPLPGHGTPHGSSCASSGCPTPTMGMEGGSPAIGMLHSSMAPPPITAMPPWPVAGSMPGPQMAQQMGMCTATAPPAASMNGDPSMMCAGGMTMPQQAFGTLGAPPMMCGDAASAGHGYAGMGPAWVPPSVPQQPSQTMPQQPQQQQQQQPPQSSFPTQPPNVIVPGQISAYFENWTADQGPASNGQMPRCP